MIIKTLLIITVVIFINIYGGLIYEGHLVHSNLNSFTKDMAALIKGDKDYKPGCTEFYNPFRWWKSKEEQRKTYRNSPLLCD